ncbi:prohibitin family protein [Mucilaginibacter lappiensis]|uniref:Regulator of protease activity HflC (Stomatin/prohibitin superfamily) n=1 Tax=Mucilaginibacter lappiensis TaxID=354630 RepID=A0A1N7EES2_9SPHI|nr:prohibitin family protein [Mucilaginibacter lappiensis]MBB6111724.1 regulator of protease activity HflC (stomatin/prohibitin superfamily) [Mucilaginibacter lappiensis]MBB6128413.1 regulator of protease activity HflC (stomatin/prohibitin superfamily) [Mucilaginibacter lappiensis]SIR86663.1 SPFH domain, Band 7 family protein [Mucilaginibacter lappiensis]
MFIAILGVIVLVVGIVLKRSPEPAGRFSGTATAVGLVIVAVGLLLSIFKVIEPGKVGVQTLFGKVQDNVLESGLHIINPLVDITTFDIQTQTYTMSAVSNEGQKEGDDAIRVLSSDGLEVTIDLSVLYKVSPDKAPFILQNIGENYLDKIVRPVSRTAIRDNAVNYAAVDLYSTKRQEFQDKINRYITANFAKRGLELQQILVRNITLPASVRASIESKINAEQDAQKMQFVLQKERQEAERKRVEAQGIADYQKILSTGLSDKQLQYEAIKAQKEIALSPNAKVIIIGGKGNPIMLSDK